MKKKKLLFLIPFIFAFVLAFIPVAHAEENGETQTTEVFEKKSYTCKDCEDTILVTLVSETEVELYNTKTEETVKGVYMLNGTTLTITKQNISEAFVFEIKEDNTLEAKTIEDKVSVFDRANDFVNTWFQPVLNAIFGSIGAGLIVFLARALIKKLTKQIENGINLNADERKKLTEDLQKMKDTLTEYQGKLQDNITEIKDILPQMKEEFTALIQSLKDENADLTQIVNTQMVNINKLKELVILLVASTPALANNGHSTKILQLLDVGKPVEESGDSNEQKEV